LRSQRQITQVRLAQLLNVSPRVYNRWERGVHLSNVDLLVKAADILQLTLDELVGRREPSEPTLRNSDLHHLVHQVDALPDIDQQVLITVMDGFVKKTQLAKVLNARAHTTPRQPLNNQAAAQKTPRKRGRGEFCS